MKKAIIGLLAASTASVSFAYAEENNAVPQSVKVNEQDEEGRWNFKRFLLDENGKWSIGAGTVVQNSPFRGEKISVIPIPVVDYSSKNIFIRGLRAGYHVLKVDNPRKGGIFLDTFLSPRFRPGDARRNLSLDFGIASGYQSKMGTVSFSVQPDLFNGGGGAELAAEYSFPYQTENRKHLFIPAVKITWQSRELAEYMWGIDQQTHEKTLANPDETVLEPYAMNQSVINLSGAITHVYRIDEHWNTLVLAKATILDGDILANPAIERQFDYSFIFGFAYTF